MDFEGNEEKLEQCEKPTIEYKDGKILFSCATDGAEINSEIIVDDAKKYYSNEIDLTATYKVIAVAVKSGYEDSETATATLCWLESTPKTEGMDIKNIYFSESCSDQNDNNLVFVRIGDKSIKTKK